MPVGLIEDNALLNPYIPLPLRSLDLWVLQYADSVDYILMSLGLVCSLVYGMSWPFFAQLFGEIIDALGTGGDILGETRKVAVSFLIIGSVSGITSAGMKSFWKLTATRQTERMRVAYFKALLYKSMSWYDEKNPALVSTQIASDCKIVQEGIGSNIGDTISSIVTFVGGFAFAFASGWELALVCCAVVPLITLTSYMFVMQILNATEVSQQEYARAGAASNQAITAIRTVTSFNSQEHENSRYEKFVRDARDRGFKRSIYSGAAEGSYHFSRYLIYAVATFYGARILYTQGAGGTLSGGDIMGVFYAVLVASSSVKRLGPAVPALSLSWAAIKRLVSLINSVDNVEMDQKGVRPLIELKGEIKFDRVTFSYPTRPNSTVLREFSLTVHAGETVALVGESGSGKSTVIGLLERFYDLNEGCGQILIDNVNITDYQRSSLRKQLGLVSQEPVLFRGTIAENIRFGEPALQSQVEDAARLAHAHEFIIALPDGYDTVVGGNSQLSGGQKQRISIARAILCKPAILLLDEATSALDNESEAAVQDALDHVSQTTTTIVIAHRLSTIRAADRICVVSKGEIIEQGSHQELMRREGAYYLLVMAQEKKIEIEDDGQDLTKSLTTSKLSSRRNSLQEPEPLLEPEVPLVYKKMPSHIPLKQIWAYSADSVWVAVAAAVASGLHGATYPTFSILLSEMVTIFFNPDLEQLEKDSYMYGGLLLGISILIFILILTQQALLAIMGERLTYHLRVNVYKSIMRQEIAWFDDDSNRPGVLSSRLASDSEDIRHMAIDGIGMKVEVAVMLTAALAVAFYSGWQLTLVTLGIAPLFSIALAVSNINSTGGAAARMKSATETANSYAIEIVGKIKTVKALGKEPYALDHFVAASNVALGTNLVYARNSGIGPGVFTFLIFCNCAVTFWVGALFVDNDIMTFTDVLRVFYVILITFMTLGQNARGGPSKEQSQLAADHVFSLIDRKSLIDPSNDDMGHRPDNLATRNIVLKNVEFSYPSRPNKKVLDMLSFTIPAGKTVALVGSSGSGKSTIVSLLDRFYDIDSGTIHFGSYDLRDINVAYLRECIAVVSQEPTLFDGTIRSNLLYGKTDATDDELVDVLKKANAYNFVFELQMAMDTRIGADGLQLSGGQRQRIAIARALLKDPQILLLDEATSALDNDSENIVQEALERLMRGRTTVVVAHRLSTVRNADHIVVMGDGRVLEQGSYSTLIEQDGVFAGLVKLGEQGL